MVKHHYRNPSPNLAGESPHQNPIKSLSYILLKSPKSPDFPGKNHQVPAFIPGATASPGRRRPGQRRRWWSAARPCRWHRPPAHACHPQVVIWEKTKTPDFQVKITSLALDNCFFLEMISYMYILYMFYPHIHRSPGCPRWSLTRTWSPRWSWSPLCGSWHVTYPRAGRQWGRALCLEMPEAKWRIWEENHL